MPSESANPLPLRPLAEFESSVHSQHGEDGILGEVFRRIGAVGQLTEWCCEFGAWDGLHLSNTANLVLNQGWRAVLIEARPERCDLIRGNLPAGQVSAVCAMVSTSGPDRLDELLAGTPIPVDYDLLSIDIDGHDIHVLRSLRRYLPKVICIEYNPTAPNDVVYEQPPGSAEQHGSSAAAVVRAGEDMGYVLAAVTECNVILVRHDVAESVVGSARPTLDDLRDDREFRCYVFSGYNGDILTSSPVVLPWRSITVRWSDTQVLPKFLRFYPGARGKLGELAFAGWLLIHDRRVLRDMFRRVRTRSRSG
jgi:hypothetical protein